MSTEPSLRNSHSRGFTLKLRRTDQAVHETTQRFVESLSKDIRISQHADLVYACKRMELEKWYWLPPLQGGRAGYLVFLPRQPIVWMDDQCKYSYCIPMRVGHAVYERKSVFLASLDRGDGKLRIEDCWMLAGEFMRPKSFSQRWQKVIDFYDCQYKPDPVLQQGMAIEPAIYESLTQAMKWAEVPPMMFAQGETAPRRLRVMLSSASKVSSPAPSPAPAAVPVTLEKKQTPVSVSPYSNDPSIARIKAHEEYPDTYDLWIQGVKKGFAAVQDLALSRKLRSFTAQATKESKEMYAKVEWNEEFRMYEIKDILPL